LKYPGEIAYWLVIVDDQSEMDTGRMLF